MGFNRVILLLAPVGRRPDASLAKASAHNIGNAIEPNNNREACILPCCAIDYSQVITSYFYT